MQHNKVEEALTLAIKREGHELDGADRLIIRNTASGSMAARRRRESYARSTAVSFNWKKRAVPRRC